MWVDLGQRQLRSDARPIRSASGPNDHLSAVSDRSILEVVDPVYEASFRHDKKTEAVDRNERDIVRPCIRKMRTAP
jgi:hypothetical protein